MTKQEAINQFKANWEEMKRVGLVDTMNVFERVENFIDAAFDWADKENRRKPTFEECLEGVKEQAKALGATADIKFIFPDDSNQ